MAGLAPAIHVFLDLRAWMPGSRPGMTHAGGGRRGPMRREPAVQVALNSSSLNGSE